MNSKTNLKNTQSLGTICRLNDDENAKAIHGFK